MVKGFILFCDLTPCIPLSLKGEGEGLVLKGFHPFNLPHLTKERRKVLERGADASLKHSHVANLLLWEFISVGNILQLSFGNMTHAAAVYPALN
ncbi:hypothetical protein ES707_20030 [subsurface metagenome]